MRSERLGLLPIFRSKHQGELLAFLLLHPEQEYTLTQLARRLGTPLTTLQREAGRLVAAGLPSRAGGGRAGLLRPNPPSQYARPLSELVTLAFGPHLAVEEEFAALAGLDAVAIYGSWAARYEGQAGPPPNDIDVLVIGRPDRVEVFEAAERAERRLGLPVNPTICSPRRWQEVADALIQR